jgi:hypothetical protein
MLEVAAYGVHLATLERPGLAKTGRIDLSTWHPGWRQTGDFFYLWPSSMLTACSRPAAVPRKDKRHLFVDRRLPMTEIVAAAPDVLTATEGIVAAGDGRTVLRPGPDLHPAHRADHRGAERRGDHRLSTCQTIFSPYGSGSPSECRTGSGPRSSSGRRTAPEPDGTACGWQAVPGDAGCPGKANVRIARQAANGAACGSGDMGYTRTSANGCSKA